jgi:hypothetical protein
MTLTRSDPEHRNIITYGDLIPTLVRRYGLSPSPDERQYIDRLERDFLRSILAVSDPSTLGLVGPDQFARSAAQLCPSQLPIYVIDDLYFPSADPVFVPLPVCRMFADLSLRQVSLSRRLPESGLASSDDLSNLAAGVCRRAELLDDGIFSGGTIKGAVRHLAQLGVSVERINVMVARADTLDCLRAEIGTTTNIRVMGFTYAAGWDHCRDLLGLHGLKVGPSGFVPYWNIPDWISLDNIDKVTLVQICKEHFARFARFALRAWGLAFQERGQHLVPHFHPSRGPMP